MTEPSPARFKTTRRAGFQPADAVGGGQAPEATPGHRPFQRSACAPRRGQASDQPRLLTDPPGGQGEPRPPGHGAYAQVVVDQPGRALDQPFTYLVPDHLAGRLQVGSYVLVPFGRRRLPGFVVGWTDEAPDARLKAIHGLLVDEPLFDARRAELARWLSATCLSSLRDALRCLLPPGAGRATQTLVELTEGGRAPGVAASLSRAPRQRQVFEALLDAEGPLELDELAARLERSDATAKASAVRSAVESLRERGLVSIERRLRRPQVRELRQQVARLTEREEGWDEVLAELRGRAPRQAEVIEALLEADADGIPVADLSRGAVGALAEKGLIKVAEEAQERRPDAMGLGGESAEFLPLNSEQQRAFELAEHALDAGTYRGLLLHGVTGSGKTEVYLHCIDAALRRGRGAIVLVPEIALTPQMVGRFRARFGDRLALLHSALGQGERFDEWHRILRGEADLVVGARSAIFAPVENLGVIVVDEENERAYKQDSPPRYHAIEVARHRARQHNAVLILGGATPSVETYYASQGDEADLSLVRLPQRIDNRPLPEVEIIDLRGETLMGKGGTFSQRLLDALADCLGRGEQAMLFLNRRGFSTFVMCRKCGYTLRCPDCAVALIYHHATRDMRCHHCDHARPVPDECDECGSDDIGFHGLGTERVADQVEREFAEARVLRMDRDTTARKGAYAAILRRFARGEANVLIGTQMIAKGHDFPDVTLVGVLNADVGLNRPDFRAAEQTFQLLTQVAGRAGRADKPGTVLVQTYNPEHQAIVAASHHDYAQFYEYELANRRRNLYPPFTRLVNLTVTDEEKARAFELSQQLARNLQRVGFQKKRGRQQYVGPAPAPLHKLRGRYRYHLLLKGPSVEDLRTMVLAALDGLERAAASVTVDVDPLDMM